jgi:hypothetical protein
VRGKKSDIVVAYPPDLFGQVRACGNTPVHSRQVCYAVVSKIIRFI